MMRLNKRNENVTRMRLFMKPSHTKSTREARKFRFIFQDVI